MTTIEWAILFLALSNAATLYVAYKAYKQSKY